MKRNRKRARRPLAGLAAFTLAAALTVAFTASLASDKTSPPPPDAGAAETLAVISPAVGKPPAETMPPAEEPEIPPAQMPEETTTEPLPSRYEGLELSDEDIYTLACLVYHEARGEPFEGQVAVIEVVFNRMLSEAFPDTVEEVVFQKLGRVWQFSPAPYLYTAEPGETQYEAIYTALSETEYTITAETVFFSTKPYNEKISAIIGNHYFCEIEEAQ